MSNGMPASGDATSRVPGHATSRSNAYDPALVRELIMGPNPLRLCEETLDDAAAHGCALAPGSLVLDLGSGRGLTSAFLARHWGVRVERIRDLSCNDEAWRDWVACDNPYAAGDRRAIEAGALAWLTTTEVVLRRL